MDISWYVQTLKILFWTGRGGHYIYSRNTGGDIKADPHTSDKRTTVTQQWRSWLIGWQALMAQSLQTASQAFGAFRTVQIHGMLSDISVAVQGWV